MDARSVFRVMCAGLGLMSRDSSEMMWTGYVGMRRYGGSGCSKVYINVWVMNGCLGLSDPGVCVSSGGSDASVDMIETGFVWLACLRDVPTQMSPSPPPYLTLLPCSCSDISRPRSSPDLGSEGSHSRSCEHDQGTPGGSILYVGRLRGR